MVGSSSSLSGSVVLACSVRRGVVADNLRRKGISSKAIPDICLLCGKERETVDFLFLHCELCFISIVGSI